jgi:hypothetical protein
MKKNTALTQKNFKDLGFDVKLTKDDLFDLVIEEMAASLRVKMAAETSEKERKLAQVEAMGNELVSLAKQKSVVAAFLEEFPGALHSCDTLMYISSSAHSKPVATVIYRENPYKTGASLQIPIEVPDPLLAKAREFQKEIKEHEAAARQFAQEICELERCPRKARIALLRKMLESSENGASLLAAVKNLNKANMLPG